MKILKQMLSLGWLALLMSGSLQADTWIDEDGESYVVIENGQLTIYSLDSLFYFDELFKKVRLGEQLRLCVGKGDNTGMSSDCLGMFDATVTAHNKGKNRAIHVDVERYPFIMELTEAYLNSGGYVKFSIDDKNLFAAYTVHRTYKLNDRAISILAHPD